ncbi:Metallo-dependent hydrolase, partial [Wolfiporia cocos MD-104 SS10]
FPEALEVTAKAKSGFSKNIDDLYHRGRRLIVESVECGVTVMRAHVEVDTTVHYNCLKVALRLKREFEDICYVQIAVFAQDPLFADALATEPSENFALLHGAAQREGVEAVGSAPYVEPTVLHAKRNIGLILDLAYDRGLHADFHLDYNVDPTSEPLIWNVLEQLRERIQADRWRPDAHVCIGHATRLTLFTDEEWTRFDTEVREGNLPVTLVGLPPSDMYMMGRGLSPVPRTTLNIPRLAHKHGIKAAMSVNNVENAFTPQGPVDPLALCPMGVALFQCGTKKDCLSLLQEAITLNSRAAIGAATPKSLIPAKGDKADFVLLHGNESLYFAALNPSFSRTTIKNGRVVAKRRASRWILESQSNGHPR